ncbi:TIGR04282 family arsenosugar biosynthesis glycosyltransferase [Aquisalimonas sp.]|uniref:TIGR04282 family arsenosugar biosynthesis glycosyltransferase n=1 Tax=unclassified Aquisalimonas TaxID=2644645 RepID=UPI0025BC9B9A|nr:TIGR04282 family arsenosugar biosynthesis glycosyltransferase [Aquisalimonas sp.]
MADWLFPEGRILLFAKAPVAGRVKTRLRGAWGARGACRIHQQLFRRTLDVVRRSAAAPLDIWCAPGCDHPWIRARAREVDAGLRAQPPGDLGARMAGAFRATLRTAPYAIIVGGDCAALTPEHVRSAFQRLHAGDDAVFTPADDGGYVLIGLRRLDPAVFRTVPWGTDAVMAATRRRLRRLDWRAGELAAVPDVDRPADVRRLRRAGLLRSW